MSQTDDLPNALDGLAALSRRGDPGVKAVLLRVLVDLFVSHPHHTPDEISQFEEIGLRIIDDADAAMRAKVATKLAAYPLVPQTIVAQLIQGGGKAAGILLRAAPRIRRDVIVAVAQQGPSESAVALAERDDLSFSIVDILTDRADASIDLALAMNQKAPLAPAVLGRLVDRARTEAALAKALCERVDFASDFDLTPLFLGASPQQRQTIIAAARRADDTGLKQRSARRVHSALLAQLEALALARDWNAFQAELERVLGAQRGTMASLLDDPRGEALAVALAATGMLGEPAARIFLCCTASIAHSYERVKSLVGLVETLPVPAARRIINAMLDLADIGRGSEHHGFADMHAAELPSRPGAGRQEIRRGGAAIRLEGAHARRSARGPA